MRRGTIPSNLTKCLAILHHEWVTSAEALAEIKSARAGGRVYLGEEDMNFAAVTTFDVEEAIDAATSCKPTHDGWVIDGPAGGRFVFKLDGGRAVVIRYQR
jgi:hypothetical protein